MSKRNTKVEYPSWVRKECGRKAHKLTFGDDFGEKRQASLSTWHQAECDVCGEVKAVTQPRDFFHPNFRGFKGLGTNYNGKRKFKKG